LISIRRTRCPILRLAEAFVRVKDLDNAILRFGSAGRSSSSSGVREDALKVVERLLQHRPRREIRADRSRNLSRARAAERRDGGAHEA